MEFQQSDTAPLKSVLVKHAKDAFVSDAVIGRQWKELGYLAAPDFDIAVNEYDRFVELLLQLGVEVQFLPRGETVGLDSMYPRDASITCRTGAILCNMGKPARKTEPPTHETFYLSQQIPIVGAIEDDGLLEGGDVVWLGPRTIVVGRGYRTNDEGIEQLATLLGDCIDELITVPLPHWRGPADVFHLMSILSPLDDDLALVYSPLLPVPFRETLLDRGIQLVEAAEEEFETLACNVLAVGHRKVIAVRGNPRTRDRMNEAGVEVHEFDGREICLKGSGGPTCLTRPLLRD